jgi:cardiolipin synthase (CMP-forming)
VRHLPNLICLLRIVLVWPVVSALHAGAPVRALAFFMLAAVSDGLDGYLAKRFGWTSQLGKTLDPLADKLLLVAVFIEGAWLDLIPWWLTAAVVARDVMIGLGALIYRLWFGPLHGHPTVVSKVNTGAQLLYVMIVLLSGALQVSVPLGLQLAAIVVFATTVVSGADYLITFTRRAWELPARSH